MKIAYNGCYGGFSLSPKAKELYLKKIGKECYFYVQTEYSFKEGKDKYTRLTTEEATNYRRGACIYVQTKDLGFEVGVLPNETHWYETFYDDRDNKLLIETIEELGEKEASGSLAEIHIVDIPDDVDWEIDEYDGIETVREKSRSWG